MLKIVAFSIKSCYGFVKYARCMPIASLVDETQAMIVIGNS